MTKARNQHHGHLINSSTLALAFSRSPLFPLSGLRHCGQAGKDREGCGAGGIGTAEQAAANPTVYGRVPLAANTMYALIPFFIASSLGVSPNSSKHPGLTF